MNSADARTSRRDFFVMGTAALGTGVAAAAGAAVQTPASRSISGSEEREAIRQLHQAFIAGAEGQAGSAFPTHRGYRSNEWQLHDLLELSDDGCEATAVWHVDVKVGLPLEGDSTVVQMARLQGMLVDVRWEAGELHAKYVKSQGQWQVAALDYRAA